MDAGFEDVNLAGNASGIKQYAQIIAAHRTQLLAHFKQPVGATSCPSPTSQDELDGMDNTGERVF